MNPFEFHPVRPAGRSSRSRRGRAWISAGLIAAALALGSENAKAQTTATGQPCNGQYGFAIRDVATGQTVSRGWTSPNGTIGDGVALGANRTYEITVANAGNRTIGRATFTTGRNGSILQLPKVQVGDSIAPDSDHDGIPNDIEITFGLDPNNPSTLGGGILDSVVATTPPPPGTPAGAGGGPVIPVNSAFGPPGMLSGVALPGTSVDVSAFNDTIAVACLDQGVAFFNVFGGLAPRQFAMVDTPGEARAVGPPGDDCAVADGLGGLCVIDLRDPSDCHIKGELPLGGYAECVDSAGSIAYCGLRNGQLVAVDLGSVTEFQRLNLGAEVFDVKVSGDFVWAIVGNTLRSFSMSDGLLQPLGSVPLASFGPDPFSGRKRLFVGGGFAQATCMNGFDTVNVADPAAMVRVGMAVANGPASYKQVISTGSGLGLGCVGVNPRNDGTQDLYLFSLVDPTKVNDLVTILATPGVAYSSVIYNGIDYLADGRSGLDVFRYLETDRKGIPPVITLGSSAVAGATQEGKLFRVTANATDDVQVRNVEFYLDGKLLASDGNFPFEIFFNSPLMTPAKPNFAVRARAFDTGGNSTWSDPLTIELGPDGTPPQVARTRPLAGSILGQPMSVAAFFSEPLRPDSVVPDAFRVVGAGVDGLFGTADDVLPPPGVLTYQDSSRSAVWTYMAPLPAGLWQATVSGPIADRAGNVMTVPHRWSFRTFDQPDRDGDGLPDAVEIAMGFNPDNPDSLGDGVRDGDRDFDHDGLANGWEIFYGLDPKNANSRDPKIPDGLLDLDGDGLNNLGEQAAGTNPMVADTDGDGWNDEAEISAGSDPLDPKSTPRFFIVGQPAPVRLEVSRLAFDGGAGGLFVASPIVSFGLPGTVPGGSIALVMGSPIVTVGLPSSNGGNGIFGGLTVASPRVSLGLPATSPTGDSGLVVGAPPLTTKFAGP